MRALTRLVIVLSGTLALSAAAQAAASADPSTPGALRVAGPDGAFVEMPLRHTKVAIEVTAFVARATIEQAFVNPFDDPVEAVYTFPLGDRAAVDDFELQVGDRTIRGEIRRREEARAAYEQARAAGHQAALLEQERPNVFTQSVANLEPGKPITVRLRTIEALRYERGVYRLTFPLVVGPRYIPRGSVPDAQRISSPALPPDVRSRHDVEISVTIAAGVPLTKLESPSHRILEQRHGDTVVVRLAPGDTIPNKDFLLRWSVASEKPAVGLLAHRDGLDGFFTLLVQPKGDVGPAEAMPKEITFVLDTSGSMSGVPIQASKRLVSKALRELGPRDTFNLIRFAGDNEVYSKEPLPNDRNAIEAALAWFDRQQGGGGTELLAALRAAFARPADPNRMRVVVFLTDGYVGNDPEILAEIGKVVGDARIYTVGIGSSVNHHLLDRMADVGRGAYVFVRPDESPDDALDAFRSWVTRPYLTDLAIDWGALPVADLSPEPLRDLGAGQTLTLVGRYLKAAEGDVVVRGRLGGRYWEQKLHVVLPERENANAALASVWARGRIEDLLHDAPLPVPEPVKDEVTVLALSYRLMSPYTSFVAVDESRVVDASGQTRTVRQALPLPEGVTFDHVVDEAQGGVAGGVPGGVVGGVMKSAAAMPADYAPPPPAAGRFQRNELALSRKLNGQDDDKDYAQDSAFRLLADLADDGRLSAAEGQPALAALLAAQRPDGALAEGVADDAVATWALAEAAIASPADAALARASARAVGYLASLALPDGWPARPGGTADAEATRWARLVIGAIRPAAVQSIPAPKGESSKRYALLRASLAAARSGGSPPEVAGRSPFERLVRAIGRGHLKVVS